MNVLMLTLLYPQDQIEEARSNAKDKIQNQINSYQYAYIAGIRQQLRSGESLSIVNCLPVGIFPLQYRKPWLSKGWHDEKSIWNLSCLNVPPWKQAMRRRAAAAALETWLKKSVENRTVLIYTLYLPYLQAVASLQAKYPDMKATVIVTDLPNDLGLPTGRKGLMKKLEYRLGKASMELCKRMDGYVLLTRPMAEALEVGQKPYLVMEGLIQETSNTIQSVEIQNSVLYTGTLETELGIGELLTAFAQMPETELWICGQGGAQNAVEEAAKRHPNIRYFGLVPREQALKLQRQAACLINPRPSSGLFTRYSFPSKTLEYMRSSKPVLCYRLEGIPEDYDPYLCYIDGRGAEGIQAAVRAMMSRTPQERAKLGEAARTYVMTHKTPAVQGKRLCDFLRSL